jgi:hypothetical protein
MFHAQMRLSLDGCRKLSNFLSTSSRVRALSLSHNFLGDDGMKIICEGLVKNKSVTGGCAGPAAVWPTRMCVFSLPSCVCCTIGSVTQRAFAGL